MQARSAHDAATSTSAVCASAARESIAPRASAHRSANSEPIFRSVVARAAARFRPAGRGPFYFARGKLGGDPVFAALLRDGRIKDGARIVDIGCGLGILAALLATSEQCDPCIASEWPPTWPPPPRHWTLRGFDLRKDAIAAGQRGLSDLGDRVSLTVRDACGATMPACDVVVMLDVLHYLDCDSQRELLTNAHGALAPGGLLLLRVGDITSNWRSRFTLMVDWWVTSLRDRRWPRFHCRSLAEWKLLLESIGYSAVAQPMSEGTLFANVLLIASKQR